MRRTLGILIFTLVLLGLPGQAQAVSMKTTRFVATFEGYIPCVYADPAGHATIGYGHLLHYGAPTRKDRRRWGCLTQAEALNLLKQDLRTTEVEVLARIEGARVTPSMVTALTSFAFNLGAGALDHYRRKGKKRATDIALHVRQGKYRLAANEMLLYDGIIVNGKRYELEGLRIRRRKEARLMLAGIKSLGDCQSDCTVDGTPGGVSIR